MQDSLQAGRKADVRPRALVALAGTLVLSWMAASCSLSEAGGGGAGGERPELHVSSTADFALTGDGTNPAWKAAQWVPLRKREADGLPYRTRIKALYSETGLYFLMDATDGKITASMEDDFLDLWNEDVFEVFLWPDERYPVYFEYEISPLERELPILVPNFDGEFLGWRPWHYDEERRTRKATAGVEARIAPGAEVAGWRAEVFIPYALLKPLRNVPPRAGSRWRANFYRVDHDAGGPTSWDWAAVGPSFHEFRNFGTLRFN